VWKVPLAFGNAQRRKDFGETVASVNLVDGWGHLTLGCYDQGSAGASYKDCDVYIYGASSRGKGKMK
jgi:hypothetical protein